MDDDEKILASGHRNQHKRSSTLTNGYCSLPEVYARPHEGSKEMVGSEGKETVPQNVGLEVAGYDNKEAVATYAYYGEQSEAVRTPDDPGPPNRRTSFARHRKTWIICIVISILAAAALGVGLGIGLTSHHQAAPDTNSPSSGDTSESNPSSDETGKSTISTHGAFNGSGISLRRQARLTNLTSGVQMAATEDPRNLILVYQHASGELRWMQRSWPNSWLGGSASEVVTSDAKNGTALSILATSDTSEGVTQWHVFYVDANSKLRQRTIDNTTMTWRAGLLNDLHISTLNAERAGLVTCYYTGPIDDASFSNSSADSGIRLWVATSETTFAQIAWRPGMPRWVVEQQWTDLNGHAQPACNGWSPGTVTYAMFVDQNHQVAFYWSDHGNGTQSANKWEKASLNIPAVDPEAGLSYGYGGNLYARTSESGPILGWNITFAAADTVISGSSLSEVGGGVGTPDTSLASWSITPNVSPGDEYEVLVFYQREGDDITMSSGDVSSGVWTTSRLPIPND